MDPRDFQLYLLPGTNPPAGFQSFYEKAYLCWRNNWEHAFKMEMGSDAWLSSDQFTRQDEILALFYQGECVGVSCFRRVDFNLNSSRHDSYFEHWPETAMHSLLKHGKRVLVISQFAIDQDYRKSFQGVSLRDLLIGLSQARFSSDEWCETGATALRIQKHMEEAVYKVGATPLVRNMPYILNQTVDLVGYFHGSVYASTVPGISELVDVIFPKTIALVYPIIERREVSNVA